LGDEVVIGIVLDSPFLRWCAYRGAARQSARTKTEYVFIVRGIKISGTELCGEESTRKRLASG
jgi:hypothetical protein